MPALVAVSPLQRISATFSPAQAATGASPLREAGGGRPPPPTAKPKPSAGRKATPRGPRHCNCWFTPESPHPSTSGADSTPAPLPVQGEETLGAFAERVGQIVRPAAAARTFHPDSLVEIDSSKPGHEESEEHYVIFFGAEARQRHQRPRAA